MKNPQFLKSNVKRSFNQAAKTYDQAALMQNEIGDRLVERLDYMRINPNIIADIGCGTGHCTQLLSARYPVARLIALDLAENMLREHKQKHSMSAKHIYLCGDAEQLPIATNSVDLVFSNLMLHWSTDLATIIAEIHRILKPDGLFLFSTLGPDTFKELRQSWAMVDHYQHVHDFIDMHDIGDALVQTSFADPVMDMEQLTLNYQELQTFFSDLKKLGAHNISSKRNHGLLSKNRYQRFLNNYETFRDAQGNYPTTFEVIYGHAWGSTQLAKLNSETNEATIPITSIQKKNF